jgi:hypothetical protein
MSRALLSLAGFQVIISGRFWVIAEETAGADIVKMTQKFVRSLP